MMLLILTILGLLASNAPSPECLLTRADTGKTIAIPVGKECTIRLHVTAGTGFSWIVDKHSSAVEVVEGARIRSREAPVVGAQEQQQFTVTAKEPGRNRLTFVYVRPWNRPAHVRPENTFSVVIQTK